MKFVLLSIYFIIIIYNLFYSIYLNDDISSHTHDDRYYTETEIDNKISELQTSFQDGVTSIYDTLVGLGVTPNSNSLTDIIEAINTLSTNKYNAGYNAGKVSASGVYPLKIYLGSPLWGGYWIGSVYVGVKNNRAYLCDSSGTLKDVSGISGGDISKINWMASA